MRHHALVHGALAAAIVAGLARPACAGEDENRLIGNLLTGLTNAQPASGGSAPTTKEREQLALMLSSGEYVTSRQGEPIDAIVAGVPLTQKDHVYIARPVPPAPTNAAPAR